MERLSTDTAHRLVWEAAGEDKEAGSALLTAGKNRGVEASCLISEEGGCNPSLAIVLHTESDERVVGDLTRTRWCSNLSAMCRWWKSLWHTLPVALTANPFVVQADKSVSVGRSSRSLVGGLTTLSRSAGEESLNDFNEYLVYNNKTCDCRCFHASVQV